MSSFLFKTLIHPALGKVPKQAEPCSHQPVANVFAEQRSSASQMARLTSPTAPHTTTFDFVYILTIVVH